MNIKIDKVLHYVWITPVSAPQELINFGGESYKKGAQYTHKNTQEISFNYLYQLEVAQKIYDDWEIVLWTNSKELIPKTVEALVNTRIQIKELSEIGQPLKSFNGASEIIHPLKPPSFFERWFGDVPTIDQCVSLFKDFDYKGLYFGDIIDFARYCIIYNYGGLSHDVNFIPYKKIDDFILSKVSAILTRENFYFAFKQGHPMMQKMVYIFNFPPDDNMYKHWYEHNYASRRWYFDKYSDLVSSPLKLYPDSSFSYEEGYTVLRAHSILPLFFSKNGQVISYKGYAPSNLLGQDIKYAERTIFYFQGTLVPLGQDIEQLTWINVSQGSQFKDTSTHDNSPTDKEVGLSNYANICIKHDSTSDIMGQCLIGDHLNKS